MQSLDTGNAKHGFHLCIKYMSVLSRKFGCSIAESAEGYAIRRRCVGTMPIIVIITMPGGLVKIVQCRPQVRTASSWSSQEVFTGRGPLPCRAVHEVTNCERDETTPHPRQHSVVMRPLTLHFYRARTEHAGSSPARARGVIIQRDESHRTMFYRSSESCAPRE